MMRFWKGTGIFVAMLCISCMAYAQDIHFSQFTAAPLTLNPALAGNNSCDYRFSSIFKGQWSNITAEKAFTYRTLAASYDMSLVKKAKYDNYGGLGISMYSDQAGDANFSTNKIDISLAYHLKLDKMGYQSLSFGIQGGVGHRSIDQSKLYFDTQFDPDFGFDPGGQVEIIDRDKFFYGDLGAGFLWNYSPSDESNYYGGITVGHLNQANLSFLNDPGEKLYIRYSIHGGGMINFSRQLYLMPSFQVLVQGPAHQANIGSYIKFKTDPMKDEASSLYFGAWYRLTNPSDGLILAARADVGDFNIAFSYDMNFSKLSGATQANGGPELSLTYTGCFKKSKSATFCPVL